jgi:hypothetical protein|tara:strand:+ start:66 stop:290 length:225 start_codon:yes stop_codon:yes gene_type:complete
MSSTMIKVLNFDNLQRDIKSNAVVNTSSSEYEIYIARKQQRELDKNKMQDMCREINTLKAELIEIKRMIKSNGS